VGETTSTGVHGANRLASNSLLECIVFGAQMSNFDQKLDPSSLIQAGINQEFSPSATDWTPQQQTINTIRQNIPRLVWENAGICREQASLASAIALIESWQKDFATLPISQFISSLQPTATADIKIPDVEKQLRLWSETHNLLDIAYLILKSAAFRTESRGGHYRLDYPTQSSEWQVHTLIQQNKCWKSSKLW
jgi:L-aspartate oxidase